MSDCITTIAASTLTPPEWANMALAYEVSVEYDANVVQSFHNLRAFDER